MEEVERNGVGVRQKHAWKGHRCLLKCELVTANTRKRGAALQAAPCLRRLGCEGTSVGYWEGGHEENGCLG